MDETENTEGQTETPAIPLPDLDATEGTASTQSDVTAADGAPSEDEDPVTVAVRAALAQEADKITTEALARARAEAAKEAEEARARAAAAIEAERLTNSFSTALRESYASAKERIKFVDEEGQERSIDDATFEEVVVKPMQKFNTSAERAYQLRIFGSLAQSAMELLPDDASREKFAKEASDQPLSVWLRKLSEAFAPHSDHLKAFSKEVETKVTAAKARGFVEGQKAPPGTPKSDGTRAVSSNQPDLTTAFGIADAKSKGLVDDDTALKAWQKLQS